MRLMKWKKKEALGQAELGVNQPISL